MVDLCLVPDSLHAGQLAVDSRLEDWLAGALVLGDVAFILVAWWERWQQSLENRHEPS